MASAEKVAAYLPVNIAVRRAASLSRKQECRPSRSQEYSRAKSQFSPQTGYLLYGT
jgi:hypothetical protein